jgi:hypothetical protein
MTPNSLDLIWLLPWFLSPFAELQNLFPSAVCLYGNRALTHLCADQAVAFQNTHLVTDGRVLPTVNNPGHTDHGFFISFGLLSGPC